MAGLLTAAGQYRRLPPLMQGNCTETLVQQPTVVLCYPSAGWSRFHLHLAHSSDPNHLIPAVTDTEGDHDDSSASSASYATEDEEYWGEVAASGSNVGSAGAAAHGDGPSTGQAAKRPDQPEQPASTSGMQMICATCAQIETSMHV